MLAKPHYCSIILAPILNVIVIEQIISYFQYAFSLEV